MLVRILCRSCTAVFLAGTCLIHGVPASAFLPTAPLATAPEASSSNRYRRAPVSNADSNSNLTVQPAQAPLPFQPLSLSNQLRQQRGRGSLVLAEKRDNKMLDLDAEALEAFPEDTLKDIEDAASRLALYAGAAAFFGVGVWLLRSSDAGLEFFASYLTEYSLSIDNLFVFLIIFRYFKVPVLAQEKVLNYGIGTAALLRFSFLYLGVEILEKFKPAFLIFAVILIGNSLKTLYSVWKGDDEDEDEDLSDNKIVQLAKAVIPFQDKFDGDRFFATTIEEQDVTLESGETKRQRKLKVRATPLLLALIVIELSDILFATDSVPAVLGITTDVFVAYTSNLFAVFGLRSLYFLLAEGLTNLTMLEPAIGLVMGFIGAKIVFEFMGYEVSTATELLVVGGLLGGGVGLSMLTKEGEGNDEQTSTPSGKS